MKPDSRQPFSLFDLVSGNSKAEKELEKLSNSYQRLREDYHIQEQILEVSHQILRSGNTSAPLEDAFKKCISICQDALGGDTSVIQLYDKESNELMGVATDYGPYKPDGYFRLPLEERSLSGLAFHAGHTIAIDDVVNDERVSQRIREQFKAKSGIAAPLIVDGHSIGVLLTMMQSRQQNFTGRDIDLMEGLAAEAALAVHTQILHKSRIQAEHRFQRLIEHAPSAILLIDDQCIIQEANHTAQKMFDSASENLVGLSVCEFVNEQDKSTITQYFKKLTFEDTRKTEITLHSGNGENKVVEINANLLSIAGQSVIQAFFLDITKRKQAEAALNEEKHRAQITLRSIADAVVTANSDGLITSLNPKAMELTGWTQKHAIHRHIAEVIAIDNEDNSVSFAKSIIQCISKGQAIEMDGAMKMVRRDQSTSSVELSIAPIGDKIQGNIGAVIVIHDVSEARKMADKMSYLASHDTLTGLVNRSEFDSRLSDAVNDSNTHNSIYALCYIDLDRFKIVNDTAGHLAGDELLKQLTAILKIKIRNTDTLARIGGDEFGLLLNNCDLGKAKQIAENIRKTVKEFRFTWDDKTFEIGASIGLIAITSKSGDLKTILSRVDSACYIAKEQGRDRVHVYQHAEQEVSRHHDEMALSQRIKHALRENRFCLWKQSILTLRENDSKVDANEIFVRMLDENENPIPPAAFIPSAERYQLMPDIDTWVIKALFKAIRDKQLLVNPHSIYFVNLSGQSMGDNEILHTIVNQFEKTEIRPDQICFEITETTAIANLSEAMFFINTLKEKGFLFALDDFGSGFSSFAYLKNLPVDFVKIDGHFIKDIAHNPIDHAMVEAINKIGHVMGIQIIGEFVEDSKTLEILKDIGLDFAQGYGIEKPSPINTPKPNE